MSSPTPDSLMTTLVQGAQQYSAALSDIKDGTEPFTLVTVDGITDTGAAVIDISGASTMTDDDIMHQTLVNGAGVTTLTYTGFLRIKITDDAGNITDGYHYIPFGTLS